MPDGNVNKLSCRTVCQIGLVVRDVEKSARAYADLLGVDVPGWIITGPQRETNSRYHDKPTDARAKLAFFQMDNISIELIEPVDGPSTWQEFLDTKGEGVHHIAFHVEDMDGHVAMLGDKGMPLAQRGDFTGGGYTYIDSGKKLGVILELLANY